MLDKMEYCDGISAVTHQIYISDTAADGSKIWIYGYEPETDFVISPWLENEKDIQTPAGSVILGSKVAAEKDMITLYKKDWPVAARLEETGSSLDTSVFVCMDTLKELIKASKEAGIDTYASVNPDKQFSSAPVRVIDKSKVSSVADWINIYVRKVTAVRSEETLTQASSGIQSTTKMLAVIAGAAWLVLLAALGITQSMLMKERTGELHVWQAIGASRRIVNRVMLSEAFLVHLAGAVAGTILAGIFFLLFGKGYPLGGTVAAVIAAVVVTVAAGLFSAWLAVKKASKKLRTERADVAHKIGGWNALIKEPSFQKSEGLCRKNGRLGDLRHTDGGGGFWRDDGHRRCEDGPQNGSEPPGRGHHGHA